MARLSFHYGRTLLDVDIPDEWIGEIVTAKRVKPAADPYGVIAASLSHPIGSPPLSSLVRAGQRVAVLVDDFTRRTPIALILPPVLRELEAKGIARRDIRIVIAAGTHRPMTSEETEVKLGTFPPGYVVTSTAAMGEEDAVDLGTSAGGIPVLAHRAVAEADVRIGLGMITPHLDAGFTGGSKIVLPGVCAARTVDAFHRRSAFLPENPLGNPEPTLRQELEQLVAERLPLHFIVNVILTPDEEVYECVAGDPLRAHRAGVEHARASFGAPVGKRYPVVLADCYPYDFDLWQSIKGIWAGDLVTADGGVLIALTAAPEGNSNYPLVPYYAGRDPEEVKREIREGRVQDEKQAATGVMIQNLKKRIRLALVSDGLTREDAALAGLDFYPTVEAAVAAEVGRLSEPRRRGAVAVLPGAGVLLPVVG